MVKSKFLLLITGSFKVALCLGFFITRSSISEIILFDGKGYEKSIGFNHDLLAGLPTSVNKMIAGDIKIEDILKFKNKDFIIDISGSLENNEGKKDFEKIDKLLNLAKEI